MLTGTDPRTPHPPTDALKHRARGISLGLYAADLGALGAAAQTARGWGCTTLHFDEMDGCFVPAMIGGSAFVKAAGSDLLRDVHLMVSRPSAHVGRYVKAGADIITVHAEAPDAPEAIAAIRAAAAAENRPVLAGLGVMPGTDLDEIAPLLALEPDLLLVLSLDPRDGTPADIPAATARLELLRERTASTRPVLAFDGGVTLDSIAEIAAAGPDLIVSGSAVFKADDPKTAFATMRTALTDTPG